jgi:uncharacterized protein (TIGR02246 family)
VPYRSRNPLAICDAGVTMKVRFTTLVLAILFALAGPASSKAKSVADDIRALYDRFVTAQNNRDLDAVRQALSDREDFLWISDGKPFWGREAMIARMASFQEAEVWRVEPDYASAKVVEMSSEAAYLHVPLVLVLGRRESPAKLKWLVEVLCQKSAGEWRISGLFTAADKRAPATPSK